MRTLAILILCMIALTVWAGFGIYDTIQELNKDHIEKMEKQLKQISE